MGYGPGLTSLQGAALLFHGLAGQLLLARTLGLDCLELHSTLLLVGRACVLCLSCVGRLSQQEGGAVDVCLCCCESMAS